MRSKNYGSLERVFRNECSSKRFISYQQYLRVAVVKKQKISFHSNTTKLQLWSAAKRTRLIFLRRPKNGCAMFSGKNHAMTATTKNSMRVVFSPWEERMGKKCKTDCKTGQNETSLKALESETLSHKKVGAFSRQMALLWLQHKAKDRKKVDVVCAGQDRLTMKKRTTDV